MSKTIEQNFADWEGSVFGFGYGTGEPHVIPALFHFLDWCNRSENGQYDYEQLERVLTPTVAWLLINALANADMIEYGTSPRYGWLTTKGQALKRFMHSRTPEQLIAIACGGDEPGEVCYPDACNCGPSGYEKGRVCINPFWQDDAARAFLANDTSTTVGSPAPEGK